MIQTATLRLHMLLTGAMLLAASLPAQLPAPLRPDSLHRDALRRQAALEADFWRGARKTQAGTDLLDSVVVSFTPAGSTSPSYQAKSFYTYDESGRLLELVEDFGSFVPRSRFRYVYSGEQGEEARRIQETQASPGGPWLPAEMLLLSLDGQGRPRESAAYRWSESLGGWEPLLRKVYDASPPTSGVSFEEIEYIGSQAGWVPRRRWVFYGNIGSEEYGWLSAPGNWLLLQGAYILTNTQGLLIESSDRYFDEGSQIYYASRNRYFYEGGRLVRTEGERATLASADEAPAWEPAWRSINEYDSEGRLVNSENFQYEGVWTFSSKSTSRYDSQDRRRRETVLYQGVAQRWLAYERTRFAYDSLGVQQVQIKQQKASTDTVWQNAQLQRINLNAQRELLFEETATWVGGEWLNLRQRTFSYDYYPAFTGYNRFRELLWDAQAGRWEPFSNYEIQYDTILQLVVGGGQYYFTPNGDSVCSPCYEFTFGQEKRIERMRVETGEGVNETRYFYGTRELSAPAPEPRRFLFENPLRPGTPVQVLGEGPDTLHRVRLLDLQGRELMQVQVFGSALIELPAGLRAGIYLLQVQEDGRWTGSQKLLLR